MTLTQFQQHLHRLYEGNVSYPATTDAEYTLRTGLLEAAIDEWDNEPGIFWQELFVLLSDAATGDKTIAANDTKYTTPTDFRWLATFVFTKAGTTYAKWDVVKLPEQELYRGKDVQLAYVTGNEKTGYSVNFGKQPTVGDTIEYGYYKKPNAPSAGADVIEMSDPFFAVYWSLAKLHEQDGEGDRAAAALTKAQQRMTNMRVRNELPPWMQGNAIPDHFWKQGSGGFGV